MKYYTTSFEEIISLENLLLAYKEFKVGKSKKKDVMEFEFSLMSNLIDLHNDLKNKSYKHSLYTHFKINDPKPRDIHKALVRDRVFHHAIYRKLYPFFDKAFISDSFSCRINKGTHKALDRFEKFSRCESKNYTKQCFVLKCDIQKFFASIDHRRLIEILNKRIIDKDISSLLENIIKSFNTKDKINKGLPLGNLTSQLLVNVYMSEFDQFAKHILKVKYYIRYADDFVFINKDKNYLEDVKIKIDLFLKEKLKLNLHPDKVFIKSIYSGVDFLGWIHFPKYKVLRTATKKRMFRKLKENNFKNESVQSYLGLLRYGNTFKIKNKIYYNKNFSDDI
ncbi:MAG: RNA-directed polymerase [Patescibacteria group bacterium]|nr:RNA-directed polymerase [Patescibacteria group bacterium]